MKSPGVLTVRRRKFRRGALFWINKTIFAKVLNSTEADPIFQVSKFGIIFANYVKQRGN